jgi:Transport protein Trs120 or TRAPPC9, TRAPP II complex subunit
MLMCRAVESELHKSSAKGSARESGASTKGPFLYQVRSEKNVVDKKVSTIVRSTNYKDLWMVQDEEVEVEIILRNNFEFDLEVISFSLWYPTQIYH